MNKGNLKTEQANENFVKPVVKSSIMRVGVVSAMNGNELWVNTETDEIVKFVVKDRDLLRKYYCGKVRVTIELLEEA